MESENHSSLQIRLFGQFEVLRAGEPVPASAWKRRKTETLLKILLTERGRVFSQDQLIELLYGGEDPHKKFGNLRGRISELRRALEPDLRKGSNSRTILRLGEGYGFSSNAPCWLDTEAFQEAVRDAERAQESGLWSAAVESFERAIQLYRGEFLETDRYEEWSVTPREHWQEECLSALAQLAECQAQLGNCSRAITACKRLLKIQPTRESVTRQLMRYHYLAGEDSRAMEAFEIGRRALKERLDAEPSSETQALYEQIRQKTLPRQAIVLDPLRIAVLPFVNLCPDPGDEYFVDGMTEELIYSLSKIRELKVIAQTSILTYKGTKKAVPQIGRELRVGTVLEGSVRKADSTLRITAQLIDANSDEHIWASKYDRELDDVFAIQTEIARQVTAALRSQMLPKKTGSAKIRYSRSTEAYRLYLEGRFFLKKRFGDSLQKARESFERALKIDGEFAQARASFASTHWLLAHHGFVPFEEGIARAQEEAQAALALDDRVGKAYSALGAIQALARHDLRSAAALYDRAMEAEPQNVEIRHHRAANLLMLGELDAAIDAYREALDIDPVSSKLMRSLGYCLDFARRHDEALVQLRRAERLEKRDWSLYTCYGNAYLHLRQYEKAREAYALAMEAGNEASIKVSLEAVLHAYVRSQMGEQGALESTLADMVDDPECDSAAVAIGYFLLGQHDPGFKWLARARDKRASWYLYILQEPLLDPVRGDPRYQEHLARLGVSLEYPTAGSKEAGNQ